MGLSYTCLPLITLESDQLSQVLLSKVILTKTIILELTFSLDLIMFSLRFYKFSFVLQVSDLSMHWPPLKVSRITNLAGLCL